MAPVPTKRLTDGRLSFGAAVTQKKQTRLYDSVRCSKRHLRMISPRSTRALSLLTALYPQISNESKSSDRIANVMAESKSGMHLVTTSVSTILTTIFVHDFVAYDCPRTGSTRQLND